MATGETGIPDKAWSEHRQTPRLQAFAARTAGLYSEVVWDRDWSLAASAKRSAATERHPQTASPE